MLKTTFQSPIMVVDIGNTNIVCAIYREGQAIWSVRLSSRMNTSDEYYAMLSSMIRELPLNSTGKQTIAINEIEYIALGSVVPELSRVWKHLFQKYFSAKVYEIDGLSALGLKFKVKNPSYIGADLIANAFAAWKKYQCSTIVIDLGTATTIQVVSSQGVFEGAVIAPGLKTGAANLFVKAAQLNEMELISPKVLLGTNTCDAVLSGIVNGHAFMLESYISKLKLQYFDYNPISTILCGCMADLLMPLLPSADIVDKSLTLDGFYLGLQVLLQG